MPSEDPDEAAEDEEARDPAGRSAEGNPPTLPYATPPRPVNFKTLRRMPSFEANLAASKLEAAGITCFIADEHISAAHPLAFSEVRLQVAEADLERAAEVLATPLAAATGDDDEEEDDNDDDDDDYVDEAYRCPRCRQKAVDLLPVSPGVRSARLGCAAAVLIPVLLGLMPWLVPPGLLGQGGAWPTPVVIGWVVVVCVLSYVVLSTNRRKRCRECGWEWGGDASD